MSEGPQSDEKTEQPTPKRLDDARKKGQVARSKDLNTSITLIAGSGALILFGSNMMTDLLEIMKHALQFNHKVLLLENIMLTRFAEVVQQMIFTLLPFLFALVAAAFLGPVLLGGFSFSVTSLAPKFSRLNPLSGLKRIFSVKGLMELVKAFAKFLVIASLSMMIIWVQVNSLLGVADSNIDESIFTGLSLISRSFFFIATTTLVLAAIDGPFQLWQHMKQLKMSKQEIKDEHKESEGNPESKSAQRRAQQRVAQARMMEEVPTADVVITNPTHFAVALRYDEGSEGAPRLVAKGKDLIAEQIKYVADSNDVPIISSPPLARSIFFNTELKHEVPHGLYVAVAQVLAYVYQLKRYKKRKASKPKPLGEMSIPTNLQVEEK